MKVNIIGAGLAGCEAANFLANRGVKVRLFEQKAQKYSDHTNLQMLPNWYVPTVLNL